MTDRPILFSGPMVQALLEGRKTQTRRVVKPQPQTVDDRRVRPWDGDAAVLMQLLERSGRGCPYGKPGDLLWVRETFMPMPHLNAKAFYRASDGLVGGRWSSPIHMPRALSRLTLRITDVRVQRLNDINGLDAMAEGLVDLGIDGARWHWERTAKSGHFSPWRAYRALWESLNGAGSWNENPWVWALTFEVIPRNIDAVLLDLANAEAAHD